ncbi:MAG: arsenate reductase ArsC [Bacteroidetes bacterium]|nr:arsenate reductase ArsC [Bacteroidota bacterium]
MKKILFVCVENSNRSQMAEAFARLSLTLSEGEGTIQVFSAGSKPSGKINPKAIEAMKEIGYDLTTHKSKSLEEVMNSLSFGEGQGEAFEYVITMGCGDDCPFIPAKHRLDWQIPQPKDMDKDEFRKVRDMIEEKVKRLMENV